jgi:hypothetical protein
MAMETNSEMICLTIVNLKTEYELLMEISAAKDE